MVFFFALLETRTEQGLSAVCTHVDWRQDGQPDPRFHLGFFPTARVGESLQMATRSQKGRALRVSELRTEMSLFLN